MCADIVKTESHNEGEDTNVCTGFCKRQRKFKMRFKSFTQVRFLQKKLIPISYMLSKRYSGLSFVYKRDIESFSKLFMIQIVMKDITCIVGFDS